MQARAAQTGDLHGQQVVAAGDTGTALMHDTMRFGCRLTQQRLEGSAQFAGRQKAPLCIQILRKGAIAGARNMPRDRVDGLDLAAIAGCFAGIDQDTAPLTQVVSQVSVVEPALELDVQRFDFGRAAWCTGPQFAAGRLPGLQSTIEQLHVDAALAQQPPRPRRQSAGTVVINDHLTVPVDAPTSQCVGKRSRLRQGMATGCRRPGGIGKVLRQIGEVSLADVPCRPGPPTSTGSPLPSPRRVGRRRWARSRWAPW